MNKILLIVNPNLKDMNKALSDVNYELRNHMVTIFNWPLDNDSAYKMLDELLCNVDTVITLGGDGSMLKVAELVYKHDVNLLGINYGGVGYLTSLKKDELSRLNNEYYIDEREMLDVCLNDGEHHYCLNDVVICKTNINIPVKLRVDDGDTVSNYFADGIIVSTATGSSAYSYSAGAPLIKEGKMILTPICPVNRSSCYKIYNDDVTFKISSYRDNRDSAYLSMDGSNSICINKDDVVTVKRALKKLKIVRFKND